MCKTQAPQPSELLRRYHRCCFPPGPEPRMRKDHLGTVGYGTEIKLQILQEYANACAQILKKQRSINNVAYTSFSLSLGNRKLSVARH
jgi:hypothetical protein